MKSIGHFRSKSTGQATVEFAACLVVMVIFVYGLVQFSHMVSIWTRLAAVAREGGRSHVSLNYGPTESPTEVFTIMEDMVRPGKIDQNGAICVSIIRREGNGSSTDKMVVIGQHYKRAGGVAFTSRLGTVGTEVPDSVVSIELVTVEQTVVGIEVFYDFSKDTITPIGTFLDNSELSKAYEIAFF